MTPLVFVTGFSSFGAERHSITLLNRQWLYRGAITTQADGRALWKTFQDLCGEYLHR